MNTKAFERTVKLKRRFFRNFNVWHLLVLFLSVVALSMALPPVASSEPSNAQVMFANTVDSELRKPGDEVTFTITYSNNMSQPAYNVTIFKWMPSSLTFLNSNPFYDGTSDPEVGFYRWSRGDIPSYEAGTIVVTALVNNVQVETEITSLAHLTYELENGTRLEVTADAKITVLQAAGVDVYQDQIHSVAPHTGEWTEYNVTIRNIGNGLDTFDISLRSLAYNPSGSTHDWTLELYNSTGYWQRRPIATVYDDNINNRTSWTDHGVVSQVTLESEKSTWHIIKVIEAEGSSGSGDAYLAVQLMATSVLDSNASDSTDQMTIVKSAAGLTLGPDYARYARPGDTIVNRHILINSGQTEVIDIYSTSPQGWNYSFSFDDGTALEDTDSSGSVDVGILPKNEFVYIQVTVTVPYGTAADIVDPAVLTAQGVASGKSDTANDTTTVKSAPILRVEKKLSSGNPAYQGDVVTYQITIMNLGNTKLIRIPLYDTFETSCLDFVSAYPAEAAYNEMAGTVHWDNLTAIEPRHSIVVTVNYLATAGDDSVRQSANVIDAEDEFGNLISTTSVNKELAIIGAFVLTVTPSPTEALGGSFRVTWTEHGISRDATFRTNKQIICDENTTASISNPDSPIVNGAVQYIFSHYSPSSIVIMDSSKAIVLNYLIEYSVTFEQVGCSEPVYITVDEAQLPGALPQSLWIPKDSVITFSYPSPVTDSIGTTRYVLSGIAGNSSDASVTIDAPIQITGSYKTQYYLDVTTDPAGIDTPQYRGWYDAGTSAELRVDTPAGGDGLSTRYRFDHWTETSIAEAASAVTHILMDSPKHATAHYVQQYKLTVSSDHDSPDPAVGEYWYDEGDIITAAVNSLADESDGTRYWCLGWAGTGSVSAEGTNASLIFTITAPSSIEWKWKTQYYLTVKTDPVGLDSPTGAGWYDEGAYAAISVDTPTGEDGVSSRYRFESWRGDSIVDPNASSTAVLVNAPKMIEALFLQQFYLTMSTNFGTVSPESGWYDIAVMLPIQATAPTVTEGDGFVWHGWTGAGDGSYGGMENPATVTMNSPIAESAYWKVAPLMTIAISSETVASGDRVVVYGTTSPVESGVWVVVTYTLPNGTQIEHTVSTDDTGNYEDTLLLDQDYVYNLFVDEGEWVITACRLGDPNHEDAQASTNLKIEPRPVTLFFPTFTVGAIVVIGLIAYIPYAKKMKYKKTQWSLTFLLSCAGLILGAISLTLNWMAVAGTAVTNNTYYQVDIAVRPFQDGIVSITEGVQYVGGFVPPMAHLSWQNLVGGIGPVLTLYLAVAGYALALIGLYKPKTGRQRRLKMAILVTSGILAAASVVHAFIFAYGQANAITGASIGFGIGIYLAVISSALLIFSGVSAKREIPGEAVEHTMLQQRGKDTIAPNASGS